MTQSNEKLEIVTYPGVSIRDVTADTTNILNRFRLLLGFSNGRYRVHNKNFRIVDVTKGVTGDTTKTVE